jgi:NADPH:quinone reductase-like Zn-dependent oxidoreductase
MGFNDASSLPMAIVTTWAGWHSIGLPRDTAYTEADKEGLLVWGGAGSIGSAVVQVARSMGFSVYATASEKHHEYLKGLGASRVFDYKSEHVVESIVNAAKEDGLTVQIAYDAAGQLKQCLEILKALKGEGTAKVASAVPLLENSPVEEGVEVAFVAPPVDAKERTEFFHFVFSVWLKEQLDKGAFVPSPKIQVVERGLGAANKALDEWKKGVSKLVFEV